MHDKKRKGKQNESIIGRGKEGLSIQCFVSLGSYKYTASLAQDDFLDIIRSGGIVSKA